MILTDSKDSLYYFLQMVFPDWDTILNGSSSWDDKSLGSDILFTLHDKSKIHKLILDFIHYFIKNRNNYDINTQNDNGYTLLYILVWYLDYWRFTFLTWANDDINDDNPFIFYNPKEDSDYYDNHEDKYSKSLAIMNFIQTEEELDYYLMHPYLLLYKKNTFLKI